MGSRRDEIRALLALRDREGLTYAELAARSGESKAALSWWSWKLRSEARAATTFAEVVVVDDEKASAPVTLEFGDMRIEITRGFDAELLREVLEVVRGC